MRRLIIAVMVVALIVTGMVFAGVQKIRKPKAKPEIELNLRHAPPTIEAYLGKFGPTWKIGRKRAKQQFLKKAREYMDNNIPTLDDVLVALFGTSEVFEVLSSDLTKDDPADSYTQQYVGGRNYMLMETTPTAVRNSKLREEDEDIIYIINLEEEYNFDLTGHMYSPIVLDMDGNGLIDTVDHNWIHKVHIHSSKAFKEARAELTKYRYAMFDIDNDGMYEIVEWLGPNDGLLLYTENVEEIVNRGYVTGEDLFGTTGGYSNGYEKLALLDKNGDMVLTGDELNNLYVWMDKNQDAKVSANEIFALRDMGITSISLNYSEDYVSTFTMNGKTYKMWDWWPVTMEMNKMTK